MKTQTHKGEKERLFNQTIQNKVQIFDVDLFLKETNVGSQF